MTAQAATIRCVRSLDADLVDELARLLVDCVEGGASVGFMQPLDAERARSFWRRVAQDVDEGARALLVAEQDGRVVGSVHLVLSQPENQPHRAELVKMLVRRCARRQGLGAALLREVEALALARRKTLLVLDTANPDAERLYQRQGWQACGTIPGYALLPQGGLCATTFYFRQLEAEPAPA